MKALIGISAALFLTATGGAAACDQLGPVRYAGESARHHIYDTALIFEGVVLGRADAREFRSVLEWAQRADEWTMVPVRFQVTRVWKGEATDEQVIWSWLPDVATTCEQFPFEVGQPYLVMANPDRERRYESPDGDIVGAVRWEMLNEWVEVELPDGYGTTWERQHSPRREEYFGGLGSYRAVLQQMADDGVLPDPVTFR